MTNYLFVRYHIKLIYIDISYGLLEIKDLFLYKKKYFLHTCF